MYELSRVRLHSIGPKGARYQDVTLDLRDVGALVTGAPQGSLLEAPVPVRRPSPASVLFTENGSGKSVLMKLIFSVMLPGRRQVVGTSSSRVLENFVLDTDVAQVALEWQHTVTGSRVVTGKVAAWRGHVVSTDPTRLTEAWYSFHPSPEFGLDDLPLTENGRLVSLSGFRERLTDQGRREPALQILWETNHGAWTEHLEGLELDPTLFVYQRRMNAGEGEAADAFSFASDEAFVDWLLRSVLDEEDPRDLAAVLEGYASILAKRETLSTERDFVAGALEWLGMLASATGTQRAAADHLLSAERALSSFAESVRRRHAEDSERLVSLDERASALEETRSAADAEQRRLDAVVAELQRRVAQLRLRLASAARDDVARERAEARRQLAAWQATGVLLRARQARQAADSLRTFVGQKEGDAAPILASRDAAARRLVRGLTALAAEADRLAHETVESSRALDVRTAELSAEEREHALLAERRRGHAQLLRSRASSAAAAADQAVADGLIDAGADPATVSDRAAEEAAEAERLVREADDEQPRLARRRTAAQAAGAQADQTARAREHEVRTLGEQYDRARRAADVIVSQERAAELLGADTVHADSLNTDAPALLTRLGEAVADAEAERTGLQLALASDRAVLEALGTGGLLPPPPDVSAACAVLRDAGLACYAGWEYLARLPEAARDAALRRYPHLIDGVVLTNPSVLPRAQDLLTKARLLPRSVVAVGVVSSLQGDLNGDLAEGTAFVVPPNPAMYDEALAEAEREALLRLQEERQERLAGLERRVAADRRLGDRVEEWLREYPPGTLGRLEDELGVARSAQAEAAEQAVVARSVVDDILTAEQELADRLPSLRRFAAESRRRAERLAAVAAESVQVAAWNREADEALENAGLADSTAHHCLEEAQRLRGVKEETVRRGDDQRRIAFGCREEIAQLPGVSGSSPDDPAEEVPVQTLRVAYRSAAEAYAKVEVGQDLRAQLDAAERAEADAQAALEALRTADRDGAATLLDTPDGSDGAGRSAATERAERSVALLDERVGAAEGEVGRLRHAFEALPSRDVLLPREFETIGDGEELVARASADRETARRRYEDIERQGAALTEQLTSVRQTQDGFADLAESIGDLAGRTDEEQADVVPHAGSLGAARERVRDLRSAYSAARSRVQEAAADVRKSASQLHKYAANQDFERAQSPVRQQILATEVDVLADHATEWEAALRPRLRTLTDDLENIGRHRSQITTRLRGMVTTALTVLQAAERVSVLPETLGDWAGQKFLRIRFADPDRATLDEKLGEVIDEFATGSVRGDSKQKRDGMSLLLRGVRAAMPRGVRVEMLKPDASERAERVRIAQVADVFSGGQLLTAAIILYCTMAALRANERGQTRRPHAGVLFLDNPIGRASAGYLLELQLGVADALGVQLIYTTGLFDVNALSVFPLIVRLRNDRDLRSGLRFLVVEDEIKQRLDALGSPDGTGQLTAARLFRKPAGVSS